MAQLSLNSVVDSAISWLGAAQAPSGEVPAWASPLDGGAPVWLADSLKFITGLAAATLATSERPAAAAIVDRAVGFVEREREPHDLWRYWSRENDQYDFTPPDADDTACCSLAVAARGASTTRNVALLMANRDPDGRFYTWLIPHPGVTGLRWWRAMAPERTAAVLERRAELWSTTEADPDDVDVVVNANVCRYLGAEAPGDAVDWVASVLRDGIEVGADKWHRNPTTFYASVAQGARRGVTAFAALEGLVTERIQARWDEGTLVTALDRAQSLLALQAYDVAPPARASLTTALADTQQPDGSWERSIFYFGGPKEVFGWASEALAGAYAAAALDVEARR